MKIFYDLNGSLYVNITNQCPCACTFCIRKIRIPSAETTVFGSIMSRASRKSKKRLTRWIIRNITKRFSAGTVSRCRARLT